MTPANESMTDDSTVQERASGDMGAVTGPPLSAVVAATGAPVVAGDPAAQSVPPPQHQAIVVADDAAEEGGTQGPPGVIPTPQGVMPCPAGVMPPWLQGFSPAMGAGQWAWPGPPPPQPATVRNDEPAVAAAIASLNAARQEYLSRAQPVLDPLEDLAELDTWIRVSELRQLSLGLSDEAMARSAVMRMKPHLLLRVETAAGKAAIYSWELLKSALRTMSSGAHPLIAAGTAYLKEAELSSRKSKRSMEVSFEAGKGVVATFLREIANEFPADFSKQTLEKLQHCLLVPFIMNMIPAGVVPSLRMDEPFQSKDPSLDLMRTVRRFTSAMGGEEPQAARILSTFAREDGPRKMTCYACGEAGHFAAKCPSKKRKCMEVEASHDFQQACRRKRTRRLRPSLAQVGDSLPAVDPPKGRTPSPKTRTSLDVVRVVLCINNKTVTAIVDTAATISLVDVTLVRNMGWEHRVKGGGCSLTGSIPGVSDRTLGVIGASIAPSRGTDWNLEHSFHVYPLQGEELLLGKDFFDSTVMEIRAATQSISIQDSRGNRVELPFYRSERELFESGECVLTAKDEVRLEPFTQRILQVQTTPKIPGTVDAWVETSELGAEAGIVTGRGITELRDGQTKILVSNFSTRTVSISPGQTIAAIGAWAAERVHQTVEGEPEDAPTPVEWKEGLPAELDLSSAEERLSRREINALKRVLKRCSRVWRRPDERLGANVPFQYHLETTTERPINQGPRRLHPTRMIQAQAEVDRMRELDVIEPSRSPWASPIVLIEKKDGGIRFCVDYRKLNEVTTSDAYPLPRCDDLLGSLAGCRVLHVSRHGSRVLADSNVERVKSKNSICNAIRGLAVQSTTLWIEERTSCFSTHDGRCVGWGEVGKLFSLHR